MFSGIVEAKSSVLQIQAKPQSLRLHLKRPETFQDLNLGDSIACNGICLTLEAQNDSELVFALGAETLKITGWTEESLRDFEFNLERSLKMGDAIHGHLVSGHVDAMGDVVTTETMGESLILDVSFPENLKAYLWAKGSVALNGVSLTINKIEANRLSVCLIPETRKRTNLNALTAGDQVTIEVDSWARAFVRQFQLYNEANNEQHS